MTPSQTPVDDKIFFTRVMEATVRIGLIALLAIWCFRIMEPFVVPMIWGLIIAVAAHPGYVRLRALLGGRGVLAGVLFVLIGLVVLVVPTVVLSGTLVNGVRDLIDGFDQGTIQVPPPPAGVADWPLVGEPIHTFWSEAADNLESALLDIAPQIRAAASWVLGAAAGLGLGLLQFVFAIVIAGVLLTQDEAGQRAIFAIARRLAGERGVQFAELADATVRSVTRGILGVAFIQSLLAGLGFLAVGVPAAGLWALLCLLLSTVQVGIFPVTIPILFYVFSKVDPMTFVLFLVWSIFVGALDNILKPILLGRGVAVPMAVIFVGAIGGFITSGIIGLFVGSVVLVLGYKLVLAWLYEDEALVPAGAASRDAGPRPGSADTGAERNRAHES
jgi:predicted PurR-regulated permease PerM